MKSCSTAFQKNERISIAAITVLLCAFGILLGFGTTVEAKTVQWNSSTVPDLFYYWFLEEKGYGIDTACNLWGIPPSPVAVGTPDGSDSWILEDVTDPAYPSCGTFDLSAPSGFEGGLSGANVSVEYHGEVSDGGGTLISDGAVIPVGTELHFTHPQYPTDIYGFGSGYSSDSPYGRWVASATYPSGISCNAQDFASAYTNVITGDKYNVYAPLSVAPSDVTITHGGTASLSCNGDNSICTVTSPGTVDTAFTYASTFGKFYYNFQKTANGPGETGELGCSANNVPMRTCISPHSVPDGPYKTGCGWWDPWGDPYPPAPHSSQLYTLVVPEKTITYSLIAADGNVPPNAPTITGPTEGKINVPYTYSFVADDPDVNNIKYQIDWNNDGTVDQEVPSGGLTYVPSGTSVSADHSWITTGTKNFQARAIDTNGGISSWTPYSVVIDDTVSIQCIDTVENESYTVGCNAIAFCFSNPTTPGDGYIDVQDPGCHTDGIVDNGNDSYNATLDEVDRFPNLYAEIAVFDHGSVEGLWLGKKNTAYVGGTDTYGDVVLARPIGGTSSGCNAGNTATLYGGDPASIVRNYSDPGSSGYCFSHNGETYRNIRGFINEGLPDKFESLMGEIPVPVSPNTGVYELCYVVDATDLYPQEGYLGDNIDCTVYDSDDDSLGGNITATPPNAPVGGTSDIWWRAWKDGNGLPACIVEGNGDYWTGAYSGDPKISSVFASVGTYTYTLTCDGMVIDTADVVVTDGIPPVNSPPNDPVITGPAAAAAPADISFDFSATDPDSDNVRIEIDWNDDEIADETTGFDISGATHTSSNMWGTAGTYTIGARAEDINNEFSDWTKHDIAIAPTVDLKGRISGSGAFSDVVTIIKIEDIDLQWTTEGAPDSCSGSFTGNPDPDGGNFTDTGVSANKTYTITCTSIDGTTNAQDSAYVVYDPLDAPTINAEPENVRTSGDRVTLTWNPKDNTGCTVSGPGYNNSGPFAPNTENSAEVQINNESIFIISCDSGLTNTVTVTLSPNYEEF